MLRNSVVHTQGRDKAGTGSVCGAGLHAGGFRQIMQQRVCIAHLKFKGFQRGALQGCNLRDLGIDRQQAGHQPEHILRTHTVLMF